jgi:2-polyprenyl-3-methyl-5-hydroxy-6-metoxy-1,4-benzoquinol methylase
VTEPKGPAPDAARDHYSYDYYADPAMARTFEERRFGGPIGQIVAAEQARVLANMIGRIHDRTILDVGTGTGRAALLLARGAARVTAVDASEEMLVEARKRAAAQMMKVNFLQGDVHHLEFADRSFDVVVCLRVLMHTPGWRQSLAELCRVANRLVIFDYPAAMSAALLQSATRRIFSAVGGHTEAYRVFRERTMRQALADAGFRVRSVHRQFVLPIQLHKAIGSRWFTTRSERLLDRIGLLWLLGSPVTVCAERLQFAEPSAKQAEPGEPVWSADQAKPGEPLRS